jgi:hypothetical protein
MYTGTIMLYRNLRGAMALAVLSIPSASAELLDSSKSPWSLRTMGKRLRFGSSEQPRGLTEDCNARAYTRIDAISTVLVVILLMIVGTRATRDGDDNEAVARATYELCCEAQAGGMLMPELAERAA